MKSNLSNKSMTSLKEFETKIDNLERQNFDLKMQLFYLNEKKNSSILSSSLPSSPVKTSHKSIDNTIVSLASIDFEELKALKTENENLKNKLADYETNNLKQSIAKSLNDSLTFSNNLNQKSNPNIINSSTLVDLSLIDENRKRERQAALVIAEHDRNIIERQKTEMSSLILLHDNDKKLMNDLTDRINTLNIELKQKDEIINEKNSKVLSLLQLNDAMNDKIKHQDLLLKQLQDNISNVKAIAAVEEQQSTSIITMNPIKPSSPKKNNELLINFVKEPLDWKQSNSSSHVIASPKQPSKLELGMISEKYHKNDIGIEFLNHGTSLNFDELKRLRRENLVLKNQLELERDRIKKNNDILKKVRKSTEDFALLEAEELARKQNEIDRLKENIEILKKEKINSLNEMKPYLPFTEQLDSPISSQYEHLENNKSGNSKKSSKNYERIIEMYKYVILLKIILFQFIIFTFILDKEKLNYYKH